MHETHEEGCPRCGGAQLCPCLTCSKDHPDQVMWGYDATGELISCGHCGFTMHADGWMDLDMARFRRSRDAQGKPEGANNGS